jgi:hypothetical protein
MAITSAQVAASHIANSDDGALNLAGVVQSR